MKIGTIFLCIVTTYTLMHASSKSTQDLFEQIKALNDQHQGAIRFASNSFGKLMIDNKLYSETVTLMVLFNQAVDADLWQAYHDLDVQHDFFKCEKLSTLSRLSHVLWITFLAPELILQAKELALTTR